LLDADDLEDGLLAPRAGLDRVVVGHDAHGLAADLADARHDAVGGRLRLLVAREEPILLELRAGIEQQLEAIAHEHLAFGPALAERRERGAGIGLAVAPRLRPTGGIARRERRAAVHDDAQASAEVFQLLVAKMANDLDRRPLGRRRTFAPSRGVDVGEQDVEDAWEPRELRARARQQRRRIDHGGILWARDTT